MFLKVFLVLRDWETVLWNFLGTLKEAVIGKLLK